MSERFSMNLTPDGREYDAGVDIITRKLSNYADAEQWSACRDDLMTVGISLAPILAMYPRVKADLQAAIDRCTLNIEGKIGRTFVDY